jgi:hypothetical protein
MNDALSVSVSETNGKFIVLTKTLASPGGWGTNHFSHLPTAKRFPHDYHVGLYGTVITDGLQSFVFVEICVSQVKIFY